METLEKKRANEADHLTEFFKIQASNAPGSVFNQDETMRSV